MNKTIKKILKITGITIGSIFLLIVILLCGVSLYLTPERLTDIINKESSKYLQADIKSSNVRYTLWKSFPRLDVETDSITIYSRTLDSIPEDIRKQLPDNYRFLASIRSFAGQINIIDFISGRYVIHDAKIDGLNINLVAYNDSLNNYNIIPDTTTGFKKVPYITASSIIINNAGKMQYFSAATNTDAKLQLKKLQLTRLDKAPVFGKRDNKYNLTVSGKVTAATDGVTLLNNFPFFLNGDMMLRFDPFRVSLSDYAIDLGNVKGKLNMAVGIGDNPSLDRFQYDISSLNLMSLLGYLPQKYIPDLSGIQLELPVDASAKLTSPWHFSSEELPSLQVKVDIPDGDINVNTAGGNCNTSGQDFAINHSAISAVFNFDGGNPDASSLIINPFTISADGISCSTQAIVTDITARPLVNVKCTANADLGNIPSFLQIPDNFNTSGDVNATADITFRIADFSQKALTEGLFDVKADADVNIPKAYLADNKSNLSASADQLNINIKTSSPKLTQDNYANTSLVATLTANKATANFDGQKIVINGLYAKSADIMPTGINQLNLSFAADKVAYSGNGNAITAVRPDMRLNLAKRNTPYTPSPSQFAGEAALLQLEHSPEYVTVSTPDALRQFLANYDFTTLIKCPAIYIGNPASRNANVISQLSATITPDIINLHQLSANIQSTRANMAADISGLRDFLIDNSNVQPLYINMQADLDTVNINKLAHAYFTSHGGVPQQKVTVKSLASDSIAYLIPRNITADIKAKAKETVYTNLHLYNLYTTLTLDKGAAAVNGLNISSDFGHAALDINYNTADVDSIGFNANLAITDVNIVNFFKNFHALLMMMPQMKNLDGNLSIYGNVAGSIFPDMVINVPGMSADFNLQGKQLKVHQSDFIRRVTKMMLITNDDDLHIKDMNVYAHVHGNLLQLDPFLFEFDRYKLRMLGINNFNGDLYYQVALKENPFHIPFAINIEGLFHHPELRFSDTKYDTEKALRISQSIMEQNNVNIVGMMKGFMNEFLRKAAQAATDPNLSL